MDIKAAVEFVKQNSHTMPLADLADGLAEMGYTREQIQEVFRQVLETL